MNESFHNLLNHMKSTSNTSTGSWPVREFRVTNEPQNNRDIIDYTRHFPTEKRAFMERNAEDKQQLYLNGHGFLNEFNVVSFFKDGSSKVSNH